jgi:hypothetical protein
MKRMGVAYCWIFSFVFAANAADLSIAPSQELQALYQQLRAIQGGGQGASAENVVFKRDAATFTFLNGRIVFAEPVAGQVLAAHFQGEGKFELEPPTPADQRQLARFAGNPKLVDTFREAIFFFTDDTFAEMNKLMKVRSTPKAAEAPFGAAQKRYAENYNNWIDNTRKGNPVMRNLAARMLADLTDKASKGFFLADFKGGKSGNLLFHISWNRDALLFPWTSMSDEVLLLHLRPGDYTEWWSGFHLSSEYVNARHPDHRDLHVRSPFTKIDLQVGKDQNIAATAEVDYVVREGPVRVIPFNLNCVLRISSIEDGASKKISFIQEDKKLDNDPWFILDEPASPGQNHKVKISYREDSTYETRIIYDQGSGLYFVASRDTWYPSFGKLDDRSQYELNARSPKRFIFMASGEQVKSVKEKDDLVTSWKSEIPLGVLGFNYGDFVETSQNTPTVKLTAYAGRELPNEFKGIEAGVTVGSVMRDGRADVRLSTGGLNTTSMVKEAAGKGVQAFSLFEFLFGRLPFKSLTVSQQSGGSQGFPNLIFAPTWVFLDQGTQNSLGFLRTPEQREQQRTTVVREMARQWFGYLVGGKTYHDQWLFGGGADFAASMFLRQFAPGDLSEFRDIRRKWLLSKNSSGYRPVDAGSMWLNMQLNEYNEKGNSAFVSTYKGGYVWEMIRVLMYDPKLKNPNARFIAMMHEFTSTYAGQNASTEDFRKIVEKHAGKSMEWFFEQWVYGSETPEYDFSYQLSNAEGGQTELTLTLTQSKVSESFRMQLPLHVVINGEQQFLGLIGVIGTKPLKTNIKLPVRPEKVVLDPERNILAEIRQ